MQRRHLLQAAGLTILKSGTLRGQNAPSNKLNVALIGVWGRGTAHYNVLRGENVVALCDVNDLRTKEGLELFPKAKTYVDWKFVYMPAAQTGARPAATPTPGDPGAQPPASSPSPSPPPSQPPSPASSPL